MISTLDQEGILEAAECAFVVEAEAVVAEAEEECREVEP